jgi:glycosyltransferase involved in cell wall biosynthesis
VRILLANQFFWPDTAATSQLLTDVARALSDMNHEVHVVCGSSGYSEVDRSPEPNVTIRRPPTFPFSRSKAARLLSYFSFFSTALVTGLFARKYDIVVTLTTPPLLSLLGTALKRLRGTRHFIWEMDVYPEIAIDLGMWAPESVTARVVGAIADFSRGNSDGVIVLGPCMQQRLVNRGLDSSKIFVSENWADGQTIEPAPFQDGGPLRILYSGNFGLAHDLTTIADAIVALDNDPRFQFTFAGGGALRPQLQQICKSRQIETVAFRPYCSRADLGSSLGQGDIGLVTQRDACSGSVVPSKIYGIMAAGRPTLFIGPRSATPAKIVETYRCGWHVEVGDSRGLLHLLETLHANPRLIAEAGERARRAFLEYYDLPIGVRRMCALIGATDSPARPLGEGASAREVRQ